MSRLVSLLPAPVPIIGAIVSLLLCVAYLRAGDDTLFVTFLTPAVLLTSSFDVSPVQLGLDRIAAVLASAVVALACSAASSWLHRRLDA